MSVQRSPPGAKQQLSPDKSNTMHYNSDSALNVTNTSAVEENYYITKRQKRTFDEFKDRQDSSNADIKTMFAQISTQQETLNNALITIMAQNKDIQNTIETMANKHDRLVEKITALELENSNYKSRILTLENRVESLEKYSRNSSIEIRNLPKQQGENKDIIINLIKKMDSTLGDNNLIQKSDIRNTYRARSDALLVEFTSVLCRESFLHKYKTFNMKKREKKEPLLHSEHLHLSGPRRQIYVSESLTTKIRYLHYLARQLVKDKKLCAAWISYGKLLIKKEEGANPIHVTEEVTLNSLAL